MSKKTIAGNRFPYTLVTKLESDYANRKVSLADGVVLLFCCNFADPDTGIVSWENKEDKYSMLSEKPATNIFKAIELVTDLKRSATYAAVKNLLDLGYLEYSEGEYVVSTVKNLSVLLKLSKKKQRNLSPEYKEQMKYFRVPFYIFDTSLLTYIIRSKKLSYLLALLNMFKSISQHLGFFGDKRYFDDNALSLEFTIDSLKKMLKAPFSNALVSSQTVTKVFVGYFSEICDNVLPFGEIRKSGTFIEKIRFRFSKNIVNDIDIFARKEELAMLDEHLSVTRRDDLTLDSDYKIKMASQAFCDYNSAFWGKMLSTDKQKKLVQALSAEMNVSSVRALRKLLFNKSAMLFDSYLEELPTSASVSKTSLTTLAQRSINETVLEKLRVLAEREFGNNIHDEYNALKFGLERAQDNDLDTEEDDSLEQEVQLKRQWFALNTRKAILAQD